MMRSFLSGIVAALLLPAAVAAQAPAFPPDPVIRAILQQRVDSGRTPGIVVGLLDHGRRRVIAAGRTGDGGHPIDGRTLFEIGSITKTFTATLLADMAARGEVRLDQPVAELLPPGTRVPTRNGRAITLEDLAAQRSGLPRMPANFAPANAADPYVDYGAPQLYAFLAAYELPRDPGASFEYSNVGVGLLGHALARRLGRDYESAVRERILDPLGMRDTRVTPTGAQVPRVATGHSETMTPRPAWHLDALAGAGALRSTAEDMLTYLDAQLGHGPAPVLRAVAETHRPRGWGLPPMRIGLAWMIASPPTGGTVLLHDGGTGGFRSIALADSAGQRAVVVLVNSAVEPTDIALHLMLGTPLAMPPAPRQRVAIAVDSMTLDRYVGTYLLGPANPIEIVRRGAALFARAGGRDVPLWAESPTAFFRKDADEQLSFEVDPATGRARAFVFHADGQDRRAERRAP